MPSRRRWRRTWRMPRSVSLMRTVRRVPGASWNARPAGGAAAAEQDGPAASRRGRGDAGDHDVQPAPAQDLVSLLEEHLGARAGPGRRLGGRLAVARGIQHAAVGDPRRAAVVGLEQLQVGGRAADLARCRARIQHHRPAGGEATLPQCGDAAAEKRGLREAVAGEARLRDTGRSGEDAAVGGDDQPPVRSEIQVAVLDVLLGPQPDGGFHRARAPRDREHPAHGHVPAGPCRAHERDVIGRERRRREQGAGPRDRLGCSGREHARAEPEVLQASFADQDPVAVRVRGRAAPTCAGTEAPAPGARAGRPAAPCRAATRPGCRRVR